MYDQIREAIDGGLDFSFETFLLEGIEYRLAGRGLHRDSWDWVDADELDLAC